MAEQKEKSWLEWLGCEVSERVSDIAAHPFAQSGFLILCIAWFVVGWNVNILTAGLSILAITLTQMVLNRQNEREVVDHRRDVAMHAKLDELIAVSLKARNQFVGVEEREEEEIVQLKEELQEAINDAPEANPGVRQAAARAIDDAVTELKPKPRKRKNGRSSPRKKAAAKS